jgi:hypothetical protein
MTNPAMISQALLARHAKTHKFDGDLGCSEQSAKSKKARATRIMGEQTLLSHSFLRQLQVCCLSNHCTCTKVLWPSGI